MVSIAKENKINPEDLLLDDKYSEILTSSLKKLYDGEVDEAEFDEEYCTDFKAFVNMKADTKNISVDEVLGDFNNML